MKEGERAREDYLSIWTLSTKTLSLHHQTLLDLRREQTRYTLPSVSLPPCRVYHPSHHSTGPYLSISVCMATDGPEKSRYCSSAPLNSPNVARDVIDISASVSLCVPVNVLEDFQELLAHARLVLQEIW